MEFFALLTVATVMIALLLLSLYRRRRDAGLVVGIAALYYWSLYGAWYIVIDKLGGISGQHYYYLESKLFPISLDRYYLNALALYAGFIIVVELTLLALLPRRMDRPAPRLILRHEPILLLGMLAAAGSYLVIRDKLNMTLALNASAYLFTRAQIGEWFTLHQVLNRVALIPAAIGVATLAAGRHSRYFVNVGNRYTWPGYILLLGGMGAFTFVLGNKNEVFVALLTGLLTYLGSLNRPDWRKVLIAAGLGLWFLTAVDFFRGTPLTKMGAAIRQRYEDSTDIGHFVESSNEAFGAHFSMYGVLASQTPPKFGYSIFSLACSVIPRVLWPDRPRDIYLYYSESVGAVQNQGYSLHHATGWYLNFGYAGVAVGAIVLGLLWAASLNAYRRIRNTTGLVLRLVAAMGPWLFAAGIPPLVRAGPEGYKGFFLESLLIPMFVFVLATRYQKRRLLRRRPQGWLLAPGLPPETSHAWGASR